MPMVSIILRPTNQDDHGRLSEDCKTQDPTATKRHVLAIFPGIVPAKQIRTRCTSISPFGRHKFRRGQQRQHHEHQPTQRRPPRAPPPLLQEDVSSKPSRGSRYVDDLWRGTQPEPTTSTTPCFRIRYEFLSVTPIGSRAKDLLGVLLLRTALSLPLTSFIRSLPVQLYVTVCC
jgi:hypothetical protein